MMLIEETTVPQSALPVGLFKEHLRLGSGFSDDGLQDGLLEGFLRSAMAAIEARTSKVLIERDFALTLSAWAEPGQQPLSVAPVSAVAEVVLLDRTGQEHPVAASAWRLRPDMQRPALVAAGSALPAIPQAGSVRVRFLAGFGPDWSDLPSDLQQAVMLLAAHYYEYRHETQFGGGCMPFGVTALIERYRSLRLGRGVV